MTAPPQNPPGNSLTLNEAKRALQEILKDLYWNYWTTPNPRLNGESPYTLILKGRTSELIAFVEKILQDEITPRRGSQKLEQAEEPANGGTEG